MKIVLRQENRNKWLHIAILLAAVCLAYFNIFHASFSSWDDYERVVNNKDIRGFGWQRLSSWFSSFYVGDYQPLVMCSYAVDFAIGKQDPFIYHLTCVLIHALNAIILYFLIIRIQKNSIVALFAALIFALHPTQTESVSWIAELQTVLAGLFFLLAISSYASYINEPADRKLFLILLFGIAAMLSKAIAVTLPISLLALNIWMNKDLQLKKLWALMIPLLLASLLTGITAIKGQANGKWLNLHPGYDLWETMLLASYNYTQYIIHLIVPVHLSVMYPFPEEIGPVYYFYLLLTIGILTIAVIAWRRHWHILFGGILFYSINIVLLLQFIQYGEYRMADRFLYIAGIGIIFPLVYYSVTWLQKSEKKIVAIVFFTSVSAVLCAGTFVRNDIWMSDLNFFNSMLDEYPNSAVAQYSVGALYMKTGNYKDAEIHIDRALALDPNNYKAWYNKGTLYLGKRQVSESLDALNRCLAIYPYPEAYFTRSLLFMGTGRLSLALADAERTLEVQPQNARAWYIKGYCTEQENITTAIQCYTKAIAYEKTEPLFYMKRGEAYAKTNQNALALNDLNNAISLDPSGGEALYYRGVAKYNSGQNPCPDFHLAMTKGYKVPAEMTEKICR